MPSLWTRLRLRVARWFSRRPRDYMLAHGNRCVHGTPEGSVHWFDRCLSRREIDSLYEAERMGLDISLCFDRPTKDLVTGTVYEGRRAGEENPYA